MVATGDEHGVPQGHGSREYSGLHYGGALNARREDPSGHRPRQHPRAFPSVRPVHPPMTIYNPMQHRGQLYPGSGLHNLHWQSQPTPLQAPPPPPPTPGNVLQMAHVQRQPQHMQQQRRSLSEYQGGIATKQPDETSKVDPYSRGFSGRRLLSNSRVAPLSAAGISNPRNHENLQRRPQEEIVLSSSSDSERETAPLQEHHERKTESAQQRRELPRLRPQQQHYVQQQQVQMPYQDRARSQEQQPHQQRSQGHQERLQQFQHPDKLSQQREQQEQQRNQSLEEQRLRKANGGRSQGSPEPAMNASGPSTDSQTADIHKRSTSRSSGSSNSSSSSSSSSSSCAGNKSVENRNSSWFNMNIDRLLPEFQHLIRWKDGRLQKALRFAAEEDGVRPCETDPDTFIVDSDTSNCRIVDAAVCECSCPSRDPLCSHLLAVAVWQLRQDQQQELPEKQQHQRQPYQVQNRDFSLRLAISAFIKQQLLSLATEAFVPLKPFTCESLLRDLWRRLLRRFPASVAARAAAALAIGLLMRFAQNAKGALPQIPSTVTNRPVEEHEEDDLRSDEQKQAQQQGEQPNPEQEDQQRQQQEAPQQKAHEQTGHPDLSSLAEENSSQVKTYALPPEEAMACLMQQLRLQLQHPPVANGPEDDPLKRLFELEAAVFPASEPSVVHTLLQLLHRSDARAAAVAVEEGLRLRSQQAYKENTETDFLEEAASPEVYVHFALLVLETATAATATAGAGSSVQMRSVLEACIYVIRLHFSPAVASSVLRCKALSDAAALTVFISTLRAALASVLENPTPRMEGSISATSSLPSMWDDRPLSPVSHDIALAELQRQSNSCIRLAAALCSPWQLAAALAKSLAICRKTQQQVEPQLQEAANLKSCVELLVSDANSSRRLVEQQQPGNGIVPSWQSVAEQIDAAPELVDLLAYLNWGEALEPHFGGLEAFICRHGNMPFAFSGEKCSSKSHGSTACKSRLLDRNFFVGIEGGGILRLNKPTQNTLETLLDAVNSKNAAVAVAALAALLWEPQQQRHRSGECAFDTCPAAIQLQIRNYLQERHQQNASQKPQLHERREQAWGEFFCRVFAESPRALLDASIVVLLAPVSEVYGTGVIHAAFTCFSSFLWQRLQLQSQVCEDFPPVDALEAKSSLLGLLQTHAAFVPLCSILRTALHRCAQLLLPPSEAAAAVKVLRQQHDHVENRQHGYISQSQLQEVQQQKEQRHISACDSAAVGEQPDIPKELAPCTPEPETAEALTCGTVFEDGDALLLPRQRRPTSSSYRDNESGVISGTPFEKVAVVAQRAVLSQETVGTAADLWGDETPEAFVRRLRIEEFGVGLAGGNDAAPDGAHEESVVDAVMRKQRERLTRALNRLAGDLYSSECHLQLELLQNADDNTYILPLQVPPRVLLLEPRRQQQLLLRMPALSIPSLHFELLPEGMGVFNNERGFRPVDVRALCDVARSTKAPQQQQRNQHTEKKEIRRIGRFGVGFKSVFSLADEPHIFSCTGVAIKFSATDTSGLGFVLPHPLESREPCKYLPAEALQGALLAAQDPAFLASTESSGGGSSGDYCCCSSFSPHSVSEEGAIGVMSVWRTVIWLPVRPALREEWISGHSCLPKRLSVVEPHCLLFLRRVRRVSCRSHSTNSCFLLLKRAFPFIDSSVLQPPQHNAHSPKQQRIYALPEYAQHVVLTSCRRHLESRPAALCEMWSNCSGKKSPWKKHHQHWLLVQHFPVGKAPLSGPSDEPLVVALPLSPQGYAAPTPMAAAPASRTDEGKGANSNSSSNSDDGIGWPLHCFLPVRGFGLPFILQGAFNLTASREDLRCGDAWNLWLLQQLPAAICTSLLVCRYAHPELQESLLLFVPLLNATTAVGGSAEMVGSAASAAVACVKDLECLLAIKPFVEQQRITRNIGEDFIWCCPTRAVLACDAAVYTESELPAAATPSQSNATSSGLPATSEWAVPPWLLNKALGLAYVHPRVLKHLQPAMLRQLGVRDFSPWDVVEILRCLVNLQHQEHHESMQQFEPSMTVQKGQDHARPLQPQWVGRLLLLVESICMQQQQTPQHRAALGALKGIPFLPTLCGRFVAADSAEAALCLPPDAGSDSVAGRLAQSFSADILSEGHAQDCTDGYTANQLVLYIHPKVLEPWLKISSEQQQAQSHGPEGERKEDLSDADMQQLAGSRLLQRSRVIRCLRCLGVDFLRPREVMQQRILPLLRTPRFADTATEKQLVDCLYFIVAHCHDLAALMEADSSRYVVRQQVLLMPVCTHTGNRVSLGSAELRCLWSDGKGSSQEQRQQEALLLLYKQLLRDTLFLSLAYSSVVALPTWGEFCKLVGLQRPLHVCSVVYWLQIDALQGQQLQKPEQHQRILQPPRFKITSIDGVPPVEGSSRCYNTQEILLQLSRRWSETTMASLKEELIQHIGEPWDEFGTVVSSGTWVVVEDFVCMDFERLVTAAASAMACCSSNSPLSASHTLLRLPQQRMVPLTEELQKAESLAIRLLVLALTEAHLRWQHFKHLRWRLAVPCTTEPAVPKQQLQKTCLSEAAGGLGPGVTTLAGPSGTAASSLLMQLRCSAWLPAVACDAIPVSELTTGGHVKEEEEHLYEIDCDGDPALSQGKSSTSSDSEREIRDASAPKGAGSVIKTSSSSRQRSKKHYLSFAMDCKQSSNTCSGDSINSSASESLVTGHEVNVRESSPDCLRCRGSASSSRKALWYWRFVGLRKPRELVASTDECIQVYGRLVQYLHPLAQRFLQQRLHKEGEHSLSNNSGSTGLEGLAYTGNCLNTLDSGSSSGDTETSAAADGSGNIFEEHQWRSGCLAFAAQWIAEDREMPAKATYETGNTHAEEAGVHTAPDGATAARLLRSISSHLKQVETSVANVAIATMPVASVTDDDIIDQGSLLSVAVCFLAAADAACREGRCCSNMNKRNCSEGVFCRCCQFRHAGGHSACLFCCCCSAVVADVFHLLQHLARRWHMGAASASLSVSPVSTAAQLRGASSVYPLSAGLLLPQPASRGAFPSPTAGYSATLGCCIWWKSPSDLFFRLPVGVPRRAFQGCLPLEDLALLLCREQFSEVFDRTVLADTHREEPSLALEKQQLFVLQQQLEELETFLLRALNVAEYPSLQDCVSALTALTSGIALISGERENAPATGTEAVVKAPPTGTSQSHMCSDPTRPCKLRRFESTVDGSSPSYAPSSASLRSFAKPAEAKAATANCNISDVLLHVVALLLHIDAHCGSEFLSLPAVAKGLPVVPCLQLAPLSVTSSSARAAADAVSSVLRLSFLPLGSPMWLRLTPRDCKLWKQLQAGAEALAEGKARADKSRNQRWCRDEYASTPGAGEALELHTYPAVVWYCEATCSWSDLVVSAASTDCFSKDGNKLCPLCRFCVDRLSQRQLQGRRNVLRAWLDLLQCRLGIQPLNTVCVSQLTSAPLMPLASTGDVFEVISLGGPQQECRERVEGVVLKGLKQRVLAVLLPAVRRYLLCRDPNRYVLLQQQWLAARQNRDTSVEKVAAMLPEERGKVMWLEQLRRLVLLLCNNLRSRVCFVESGATGPWTPCPAALQWESVLEGDDELPSGSSCTDSRTGVNDKGRDLENRWESADSCTLGSSFFLAWNVAEEALGTAILRLENTDCKTNGCRELSKIFASSPVDELQEQLLPSFPGEVFGELSRLFSLKGQRDDCLASFLVLFYSKLQHRLLQWLMRPPEGGFMQWLQRLLLCSGELCCRLTAVVMAVVLGTAVEDCLRAEGLWHGPLNTVESQQQCVAGLEEMKRLRSSSLAATGAMSAGSGDAVTPGNRVLLHLLKDESTAAVELLGSSERTMKDSTWLLRDAWFVLVATDGASVDGSATLYSRESEEAPEEAEEAGNVVHSKAQVIGVVDETGVEGISLADVRAESTSTSPKGVPSGVEGCDGKEVCAAQKITKPRGSSVSSISSGDSVVEEIPSKGWDERNMTSAAERWVEDCPRMTAITPEEALFSSLHRSGNDSARSDLRNVRLGEGQRQGLEESFQQAHNRDGHVALGDFDAQAVDISPQDRHAAAPFVATSSSSAASAVAARRGEALVYQYLLRQMQQQIADKVVQVLWLNEEQESGQSYDILIKEYPPVGTSAPPRMTFVEVKSSTTANKYYFEISHREWNLAQQHTLYHIHVAATRQYAAHDFCAAIFRVQDLSTLTIVVIASRINNFKVSLGAVALLFSIVNPYMQWKHKRIGMCIAI